MLVMDVLSVLLAETIAFFVTDTAPFGREILLWMKNKKRLENDRESQGFRGISCRIHTPQGSFSALIPIPGRHMVYNALAGTAVGCMYGLTLEQIKQGIETLQSGELRLKAEPDRLDLSEYNVVVIEDILDTGNTLSWMLNHLEKDLGAKDVRLCVLFNKPDRRKKEIHIDYEGFVIPDEFIVGYGLDYA